MDLTPKENEVLDKLNDRTKNMNLNSAMGWQTIANFLITELRSAVSEEMAKKLENIEINPYALSCIKEDIENEIAGTNKKRKTWMTIFNLPANKSKILRLKEGA
jgi:hypothetical protein